LRVIAMLSVCLCAPAAAMDNREILRMVASGAPETQIITAILNSEPGYSLLPAHTDQLLRAGASPCVIRAMAARQNGRNRRQLDFEPCERPEAPRAPHPVAGSSIVAPSIVASAPPSEAFESRAATPIVIEPPIPKISESFDGTAAIRYGGEFKSRSMFLQTLKSNGVELGSPAARDGVTKRVTFFTDFEVVASAAAAARQVARRFTPADAEHLPLRGLIHAHVEIRGRDEQARKAVARFTEKSAYLVLQFGDENVEALSNEAPETRPASLLTGAPLGFNGSHSELEFAFELTIKQKAGKASVVLIDAEGNQYHGKIDFATIVR
jgi:hypothetical protein